MGEAPGTPGPTAVDPETRRAVEAILMVVDEPADPRLLAQLLEVGPDVVESLCEELAADYTASGRGFELVRVAGGWRIQSRAELAPYVERFVLSGQSARLSAAALETLAIVAYKQPISRAQVAAIRGVNVDAVMRTLLQRGYIAELARDTGPGQAALFGTTSLFLERLGIDHLGELPNLAEFVPGPEVVEALETGLRVGDDEPAVEPSGEGPGPDRQGEGGVVDLTVDLEVDLTQATPESPGPQEALEALEVLADQPPGEPPLR